MNRMGKPLPNPLEESERAKITRAARLKRTKEVMRSCGCPDCRSVLEILEEDDGR